MIRKADSHPSANSTRIVRLEQWSIGEAPAWDGLKAPEQRDRILCGVVYNHPKKLDGREVLTSPITSLNDEGMATTRTGTVYQLGAPHPEYLREVQRIGVQPNMPAFFRRLIGEN